MRILTNILKTGCSIALIWFIFRSQARFNDVIQILLGCKISDFLIALSLFIATKVQISIRLYFLSSNYFEHKFTLILKDVFIANFFSTILPIGSGDIYRAKALSDESKSPVQSVALITLDRLFGLIALLTVAITATYYASDQIELLNRKTTIVFITALLVLFLLTGLIIKKIQKKDRFLSPLRLLFTFVHEYPVRALSLYAYSIFIILTLIFSIYFIGKGLGIDIGIWDYLRFFPLSLIASLLPVSVGGLGVREFANIEIFGAIGVPGEQCISLGLGQYFLMLIVASAGFLLYISSKRRKKKKRRSLSA